MSNQNVESLSEIVDGKEGLTENEREKLENLSEKLNDKSLEDLDVAKEILQNLSDKLESEIQQTKEKGEDTSKAETILEKFNSKIDNSQEERENGGNNDLEEMTEEKEKEKLENIWRTIKSYIDPTEVITIDNGLGFEKGDDIREKIFYKIFSSPEITEFELSFSELDFLIESYKKFDGNSDYDKFFNFLEQYSFLSEGGNKEYLKVGELQNIYRGYLELSNEVLENNNVQRILENEKGTKGGIEEAREKMDCLKMIDSIKDSLSSEEEKSKLLERQDLLKDIIQRKDIVYGKIFKYTGLGSNWQIEEGYDTSLKKGGGLSIKELDLIENIEKNNKFGRFDRTKGEKNVVGEAQEVYKILIEKQINAFNESFGKINLGNDFIGEVLKFAEDNHNLHEIFNALQSLNNIGGYSKDEKMFYFVKALYGENQWIEDSQDGYSDEKEKIGESVLHIWAEKNHSEIGEGEINLIGNSIDSYKDFFALGGEKIQEFICSLAKEEDSYNLSDILKNMNFSSLEVRDSEKFNDLTKNILSQKENGERLKDEFEMYSEIDKSFEIKIGALQKMLTQSAESSAQNIVNILSDEKQKFFEKFNEDQEEGTTKKDAAKEKIIKVLNNVDFEMSSSGLELKQNIKSEIFGSIYEMGFVGEEKEGLMEIFEFMFENSDKIKEKYLKEIDITKSKMKDKKELEGEVVNLYEDIRGEEGYKDIENVDKDIFVGYLWVRVEKEENISSMKKVTEEVAFRGIEKELDKELKKGKMEVEKYVNCINILNDEEKGVQYRLEKVGELVEEDITVQVGNGKFELGKGSLEKNQKALLEVHKDVKEIHEFVEENEEVSQAVKETKEKYQENKRIDTESYYEYMDSTKSEAETVGETGEKSTGNIDSDMNENGSGEIVTISSSPETIGTGEYGITLSSSIENAYGDDEKPGINPFYDEKKHSEEMKNIEGNSIQEKNRDLIKKFLYDRGFENLSSVTGTPDAFSATLGIDLNDKLSAEDFENISQVIGKKLIENIEFQENFFEDGSEEKRKLTSLKQDIINYPIAGIKNFFEQVSAEKVGDYGLSLDENNSLHIGSVIPQEYFLGIDSYYEKKRDELAKQIKKDG